MLFELVERHAADGPDRTAIVRGLERLSWGELRDQSSRLSSGLAEQGVGPNDIVALVLPNGTALVTALLALSRIGAQALLVPPDLNAREIRHVLDAAGTQTWCTADSAPVDPEFAGRIVQVSREDFGCPSLNRLATDGAMRPCGPVTSDGPFCHLLTSGTTGGPRRVIRSQAALYALASAYCETLDLTAADRTLCVTPLHHGHGLCVSVLALVFSGGALVLEPGFERRTTLRLLDDHQITAFSAPPHIFSLLADSAGQKPLAFPALRLSCAAGAPLTREVWTKVRRRLGIGLRQLYGASETGMVTANMDADPEPSLESVGRPMGAAELTVGVDGEIAVRSPWAATWGAPIEPGGTLTTLADEHGWIHTADTGRLDSSGRLYLTGRKSRFINIGGRKLNPREVETTLERFPHVTRASVVSMLDGQGNEAAKAVVYCSEPVPREQLVAWCQASLAPYKIPRIIEVRDAADSRK